MPSVPRIFYRPLHRGRSGIVSRTLTRRLAGWFRELPIHKVKLVFGLIHCQKFAPLRRWCHFPGSPTDVRERSGVQGPKKIVLRESIKVHETESGRAAKLFQSTPNIQYNPDNVGPSRPIILLASTRHVNVFMFKLVEMSVLYCPQPLGSGRFQSSTLLGSIPSAGVAFVDGFAVEEGLPRRAGYSSWIRFES